MKSSIQNDRYPFINLPLPYPPSALEPFIDAETMRLHHNAHLAAYINNLNAALENEPSLRRLTLEQLVCISQKLPGATGRAIRSNAGGVYNHRLYFDMLAPPTRGENLPTGELGAAIIRKWGNFPGFRATLRSAAMSVFGSGYAFLAAGPRGLCIVTRQNQNSPLPDGLYPLLALDVWEHAYYLLHHNLRADYIDNWFGVTDWRAADERYREYIRKRQRM